MSILLVNDDGANRREFRLFRSQLKESLPFPVKTIAPQSNGSGLSGSLTLGKAISVDRYQKDFYIVDGTPADAAYIGVYGGLPGFEDIKMVVSGVNLGNNFGDDVYSSGTFGAAVQGRYLKCAPIAFSANINNEITFLSDVFGAARRVIKFFYENPLNNRGLVFNVNIPVCWDNEIRGVRFNRLGMRRQPGYCTRKRVTDDMENFWIGSQGEFDSTYKSTDWESVRDGYISITPCSIDLTRSDYLNRIQFAKLDAQFAEIYLKEKKP